MKDGVYLQYLKLYKTKYHGKTKMNLAVSNFKIEELEPRLEMAKWKVFAKTEETYKGGEWQFKSSQGIEATW